MRAVATYLGSGEQNLKAKMTFNLPAQTLQGFSKKLLHFPAAQADYVRMFLFHARFIVMLISSVVHQVKLIDQPPLFQQFQCAINSDSIELGILLFGHLEQPFGVEVFACAVDQLE
jgi:hypothetical protein